MDALENQKEDLDRSIVDNELNIDSCCDFCCEEHLTSDCPQIQTSMKVEDTRVPSRAELTLPSNLKLVKNVEGSCKVVARTAISKGIQFGPFEAPLVPSSKYPSEFPLKVFSENGVFHLDVTDQNRCNWMCLVAVAKDEAEQSLIAYQLHQNIFFCAKKDLQPEEELLIGYSLPYGRKIANSLVDEVAECSPKPEKKKRGRPQKRPAASVEVSTPNVSSVDSVDEPVMQNLSPLDLGVKKYQNEWQCSQCSAVYRSCLSFAKHLAQHYKPGSSNNRVHIRGRRRGSHRKVWNQRSRTVVSRSSNGEAARDEEENEGANNENKTFSDMGDHFYGKRFAPDDAYKKCSKRGRKKKGTLTSHVETAVESRYKAVREGRSEIAAKTYNLRTTRKAIVISEDEMCSDGVDSQSDEAMSYFEDEVEECSTEELSIKINEPHRDVNANSSMEELLEVAAADMLAAENPLVTSPDVTSSAMSLLALRSLPNPPSSTDSRTLVVSQEDSGPSEPDHILDSSKDCSSLAENEKEDLISGENGELLNNETQTKDAGNFTCDLCGKGFEKRVYLYRHIKKHTGEYICRHCKKVFARKAGLLKHFCVSASKHKDQKNYFSCNYCKKEFNSQEEYLFRRHLAKHASQYKCNTCGQCYMTKDILESHSCSKNPNSKHFSCRFCGKTFTKEIYLEKHVPVHTGQHACPICSKWLRSTQSLTNHMRMCGQVKSLEEKGDITCSSCHMVFTDIVLFRRHEYEHLHAFVCDVCGVRFRTAVSLGIHVCLGPTYTCDVCHKIFTGMANLERHKLNHSEPQHKCSKCNKSFHRRDLLMQHACNKLKEDSAKAENEKPSPFMCELCGSMFSSKSSLFLHKNLHGEKKFVCTVCGKRFHRNDLLSEHHAVHGEATFPCPTCSKMFKTKKSLYVHMKLHGGIKRFKCSMCEKCFFQKANLQKHEDTHYKGEKFSCTVCNKQFSTKAYLKVHSSEHTTGRIFHCSTCGNRFVKAHQLVQHVKMFHSNHVYVCKYCGLMLKLQHSLRRHLQKKHKDMEKEWKQHNMLKSMMAIKDSVATNEVPSGEELHLVSDFTTTEGAEVLLAVAGYGSQELQEAIASGRAQIKQGATPDTIEIALPYQSKEVVADASEGSVTKDSTEVVNTSSTTICIPEEGDEERQRTLVSDSEPETLVQTQYEIALPVELNGEVSSEGEVANATEICLYPVTISQPDEREMEQDEYEAKGECQIERAEQEVEGGAYLTESATELGQQIVIAGDHFQMGAHHIVLNPSQLEELQNRLQEQESGGTIVLEDGASNLLLYVMTNKEQ